MLLDLPSPVLVVAPDVLRHLEGDQALSALWYLFTNCKGSVQDGQRLENISWRLWHREMMAKDSYRPLTPSSTSSELTDESFVLSRDSSNRRPIGKVLYEMLLAPTFKTIQLQIPSQKEKQSSQAIKQQAPEPAGLVTLLPTPDDELLSISIIPQDQPDHDISGNKETSTSTTPSPTSGGGVGTVISRNSAPTNGMTLFPRVVVVNPTPNPTPHPTPPATPTPLMSVQLPVAVSLSTPVSTTTQTVPGKLLLPSVQFLQPVQPASDSNSDSGSTLFLHPLSRCAEPRNTQPPSSSAQQATKQPTVTRSQSQSDPGTGTSSASSSRVSQTRANVSPSSGSSPKPPSPKDPLKPVVIPSPQLPPSPDPSSSSVSSWNQSRTTADTEHSISGNSATVTTTGNANWRNSRFNNEVTVDTSPNHNAPNAGSANLPSTCSGSSFSHQSSGGQGAQLPQADAASASARKFYVSSTTTTPSPASGSSFERRSDMSQMSVSPINDEGSKQERRISPPLLYRGSSRTNPGSAGPMTGTVSQPLPSRPEPSGSSPSRNSKRLALDANSNFSNHVTPSPPLLSPQSNSSRRSNGSRHVHTRSKSESSRSRSNSRSGHRVVDALTMTSNNGVLAKANDPGGTKPRPRRKGSGDGGPRVGGDRGRFSRPQGYGVYQPLTQNTQSTQLKQNSTATSPQQKSKKNLFCFGNEDDDEDWEDENDSSSMSRSASLSHSRSRSRSARSYSPSAVTQNPPAGVEQQTRQAPSSPLSQPPILPSDDTTPQTNGRSPKDNRNTETQKPSSSQQGRPQKQLGTVLGLNGRKVVVVATDDDDDDDYDDDDDEDWEEDEESEEVDIENNVNMKENANVPSKTPEKQEQRKEEVVLEGDDEEWTSASDDDGGGPDIEPAVTANVTARTGVNDSTQVPEANHAKTVYTNGNSWQGKSKGKRKQQQQLNQPQQPPNENKPQHYPNPPAPQILQRAHSSRFVGGTGGLAQPQAPPPVKRTHSQQPPQQKHPQAPSNHHHYHNRQQRQSNVDMSQAALEAQRQLDMFAKKPKRAWSGLARTGSGLLSQLMNPDPEIFPADHPYRFRYSSGDVGMPKGVTRLGVAPLTSIEDGKQQQQTQRPQPQQKEGKKSGISSTAPRAPPASAKTSTSPRPNGVGRPMALGLQTSKSSVALPVADVVTAASVKDVGMVTSRPGRKDHTTGMSNNTVVSGGGYRPKGRPQDQELEDDTDTEGDGHLMEISSVAQQKLALLAGKRDAAKQPQTQHKNGSTPIRPDISARAGSDTRILANPSPMQIQRTQSQHVPGATATTTAPLPLGYPYNLPPAAPPSSPRTTRQLMLRKEMSESVRYNLFWSRQLSRAETSGPRRRSSNDTAVLQGENGIVGDVNGNGAPPPTPLPPGQTNVSAVPNLVQLSAKKKPGRGVLVDATGFGEPSVQEGCDGDRPLNPRRRSAAAVTGVGQVQNLDQDFHEVDGQIHVGGGGNLITRTRSWAGLAGGTGGMTRMF